MATLPVKPGKGSGKEDVQRMAALIKGSLGEVVVADFSSDSEEACKRLMHFLVVWYPTTSMKQPDERAAFHLACPRLNAGEVRQVVSSLHQYKAWLHRKGRNLKTGARTEGWLKSLLDVVLKQDMTAEQKPEKRLFKKQSLESTVQSGSSTDVLELGQEAEMPEHVSKKPAIGSGGGIEFAFATSSSVSENEPDIVSVSSGDIVPDTTLVKQKPAKAMKRPACKRPASCEETAMSKKKQKPEKAVVEEMKPEKAEEKPKKAEGSKKEKPEKAGDKLVKAAAWKSSDSFGLVKVTKAKDKAYIQAKEKPESKAYCLVNVALPAGEKQSQFMDRLMDEACKEGWTKEALVEWKRKELEACKGFQEEEA